MAPSAIAVNFDISEEQTMLVDALDDTLLPWANECKAALGEMVENAVFPTELWKIFANAGLFDTGTIWRHRCGAAALSVGF